MSITRQQHDRFALYEFIETLSPLQSILEMSSMYKGYILNFEKDSQSEDANRQSEFIWKICSALCYDVELQQRMLSENSISSLMQICIGSANEVASRMGGE